VIAGLGSIVRHIYDHFLRAVFFGKASAAAAKLFEALGYPPPPCEGLTAPERRDRIGVEAGDPGFAR
jgi:hypothetical protein